MGKPIYIIDSLWQESFHFLQPDDSDIVASVSLRLNAMIEVQRQRGEMMRRLVSLVELLEFSHQNQFSYQEYAENVDPTEYPIPNENGRRWVDAPCFTNCRSKFEKVFHSLIEQPFELFELDYDNVAEGSTITRGCALFGIIDLHLPSWKMLKCDDPPTHSNLLHIAHLIWHLARPHTVAIRLLRLSLHCMEWLKRSGLFASHTNKGTSTFSTYFFDAELVAVRVKPPDSLYCEIEGEVVVKNEVKALLFDESSVVRVGRACQLYLGSKQAHTREVFFKAGEHFIKLFMSSQRDPKSLVLGNSDSDRVFRCHQIIENQTTGTRFFLSRSRETILLCRYDPAMQTLLCNNHCNGLWRCHHRNDQYSFGGCCEKDPATNSALKAHKLLFHDYFNKEVVIGKCPMEPFCPAKISYFF